jgi:phospholipase/carboxylesterase
MPTENNPELLILNEWIYRMRMPQAKPKGILILIHGWMGDENSMWVLARNLSPEIAILAPRGLFGVPRGGYSWREIIPGTWGNATLEDLHPAADALLAFVDDWAASAGVDGNQFDLMGFSQGAAVSYTLTLLHPQRVRQLAALSGFIPEGGTALLTDQRLSGKPVFISHGRNDDLISVEQSRKAMTQLRLAGALVTYCESDTGHKISKECLKEAEKFFGLF